MAEEEKSSTGLDANVAGLLTYLVGFITGIIFLLIEKDNKFVRFHAMQSTMTFGGIFVLSTVMWVIPILGWAINILLLMPISLILWILLMIKAYQGQRFKLPLVGEMAEKQVG